MILEIISLLLLILISGFFSGTEIAFVVANKIKIEVKASKKNLAAQSALYFINHPQTFFSTVLVGNNIANIAFASISAIFLASIFSFNEFEILLISSFIILMLGELIPKFFARELSERLVMTMALPLRVISFILFPFIKVFSLISSFLAKSSSMKAENVKFLFSKEEFDVLVRESYKAGMVDKKESDIISKVLSLGKQRVYEAMRPRTEIVGIESTSSIEEALLLFIDSGYSKLPVYEESLDNVKGIIYANDFFKSPKNIQEILHDAVFVPETKKSFEMLNEFLNRQVTIAIVVDEFGGTAGIVTMEDIFEEMFGEIKDEYDIEENINRKISDNSYIINGKVEIDFINEEYGLNIPTGDYETIAGYITTRLGRIPLQGETVSFDGFTFLITRANQIRIDIVKLTDNRETNLIS
ncbi:MAG: hemolysin [Ignavibacteria bacterium RBG_16_34_14]|nr:MAG: hemolysin [Ignavibacteria bacterium RBG_16_34_14]